MAEFKPTKFEPMKGLHKVEKVDYRRWAIDRNLRVLGRGEYKLADIVDNIRDYTRDWQNEARQAMTYPIKMDKHISVYLLDNGVHSFVLLVNDMQGSSYNRNRFESTQEQEITLFIVSEVS